MSVGYTYLTRTGFSDSILALLADVYINYAQLNKVNKQAINTLCVVTTDRVINLMMVDGTKDEQIISALKKRLTAGQISFEDWILENYKGINFKW